MALRKGAWVCQMYPDSDKAFGFVEMGALKYPLKGCSSGHRLPFSTPPQGHRAAPQAPMLGTGPKDIPQRVCGAAAELHSLTSPALKSLRQIRGQKRATKIIWLLEKVLYPERLKEFNLFSSSERRLGEALITASKYFHREKTTGIKGLSNLTEAGITRSYGQELQPANSRGNEVCCD